MINVFENSQMEIAEESLLILFYSSAIKYILLLLFLDSTIKIESYQSKVFVNAYHVGKNPTRLLFMPIM